MDKQQLYDTITDRKIKPKDFEPYDGNNGRVNKCVNLFHTGDLRRGGRLVDVGGGIGDLGYAVADLFDERIIIDISWKNLEAAKAKGNHIVCCDVDRDGLNLDDSSVDVVTALDFIEHIIDPEKFARECCRVLKPEGQVFINTPNIRYWQHIRKLLVDGRFPHTSGDKEVYHGGHLAFFTMGDLCDIFGSACFESFEQIKDDEGYHEPPEWLIRNLHIENQQHYVKLMMELGCPNLLFKCIKK